MYLSLQHGLRYPLSAHERRRPPSGQGNELLADLLPRCTRLAQQSADISHRFHVMPPDERLAASLLMTQWGDEVRERGEVENIYVHSAFTSMKQELSDFPGLYIGMGDVVEDEEKVAECVFNLEVMLEGPDKIGAEGSFVEVTDGDLTLEERREIFFTLSGVISRDHEYYVTEFSCFTNTSLWPKFMVPKPMQIVENISEEGEAPEAEESDEYD